MTVKQLLDKYDHLPGPKLKISQFDTPVGKSVAVADDEFLYVTSFENTKILEKALSTVSKELNCSFEIKSNKILEELKVQLEKYFEGNLKQFNLPIKTFGSDFQKEVWTKLQELPYGSTQTYGDFAKAIGRAPSHAIAVGAACGANSHLLVIPCHRLVSSNSKGGFNSGLDRKEYLLQHEQKFAL